MDIEERAKYNPGYAIKFGSGIYTYFCSVEESMYEIIREDDGMWVARDSLGSTVVVYARMKDVLKWLRGVQTISEISELMEYTRGKYTLILPISGEAHRKFVSATPAGLVHDVRVAGLRVIS